MVTDSTDGPPDLPAGSLATMRWHGSTVVVTACGEIDVLTTPGLRWPLTQALRRNPSVVVFDLTDVTFIGSSGLSVLALAGRDFDRSAVRVVATSQAVTRPLGLMGLNRVLTVFSSLPEALAGP
ncbi:STAS domain-containing protein [Amycolatopsis sp.]|jgi:anti-anti-sigma factor|uniref:STAS domain-containing protein n=1 Tax=Amycolatopsis sp. TaxID=37632 RepID=UPI002DFFCAE4|nr:STAS domain-containing protein [Amycolatopsis sp.]